jgi:subtilisin family serine protease
MRKLLAGLVLIILAGFSFILIKGEKSHTWETIPKEKLIPDEYIVFLKPKFKNLEKIKEFAAKKGITLDDPQIFTNGTPGFVAKLNEEQIKKLKGGFFGPIFSDLEEIREDMGIQSTRARMQGSPIPQSTRARMQQGAEYDSIPQTSPGVVYVGGPSASIDYTRKVWIIDTGIDAGHQDLAAQVVLTGNLAKSFVANESNPYQDLNGHGTYCAGLIGAKSTNLTDLNVRMNGVAPGAKLVSIKVLDSMGEGSWGKVMLGLSYALGKSTPGDIISMSLGGDFAEACTFFNRSWFNSFKQAVVDKGVYVVMSGGNIGPLTNPQQISSQINFPGCIQGQNFITVGSMNVTANSGSYQVVFSDFSYNKMPALDFVAPGNLIFSTNTNNQYQIRSGTSASAAIVSGIIYARKGLPIGTESIRGIAPDNTAYPIAKVQ